MNTYTSVEITIGCFKIRPHISPLGHVFIEIMQVEGVDDHDHPTGPTETIYVNELFKKEQSSQVLFIPGEQIAGTNVTITKMEKFVRKES